MPTSNFNEELNTARLQAGKQFVHFLIRAEIHLMKLEADTTKLLELREMVQDNNPPIFHLPADLAYVNTQLLALKDTIQAYADGLG